MIVQAAGTRCPQRQCVIAVSPYITVYHDGACGPAIYRHLVGGGRVNRGAVVVIHRHTAYHTVVGTLKQFHYAFSHLLALVFSDYRLAVKLCHAYDGAVTVLAHQYYVGTVYYHLLLIHTVAYQYAVRLHGRLRRLLYGSLYALAGVYHGIEEGGLLLRRFLKVQHPRLVGSLRVKAYAQLALGVMLISPRVIQLIQP